jgi:hypothetical protein
MRENEINIGEKWGDGVRSEARHTFFVSTVKKRRGPKLSDLFTFINKQKTDN